MTKGALSYLLRRDLPCFLAVLVCFNLLFSSGRIILKNLEFANLFFNISRYVFLFVGAFLFVNAILATFLSSSSFGVIMTYVLGFVFTAFGCVYNFLPHGVRLIFTLILLAVFIFLCVVFVLLYGLDSPTCTYTEDAVIVLGSGLRGEEVGYVLRMRLDASLDYLEKNPSCVIVVSGGQGNDEQISEAEAMKRYLISRGVAPERIIKEDASTSTVENFENSKQLLDERFDGEYRAAFVTSDYHSHRARRVYSEIFGTNALYFCSDTPFFTLIPNGLREICATLKNLIF